MKRSKWSLRQAHIARTYLLFLLSICLFTSTYAISPSEKLKKISAELEKLELEHQRTTIDCKLQSKNPHAQQICEKKKNEFFDAKIRDLKGQKSKWEELIKDQPEKPVKKKDGFAEDKEEDTGLITDDKDSDESEDELSPAQKEKKKLKDLHIKNVTSCMAEESKELQQACIKSEGQRYNLEYQQLKESQQRQKKREEYKSKKSKKQANSTQNSRETSSDSEVIVDDENKTQAQIQKENDPNYCYRDGEAPTKCPDAQRYNCHLRMCVQASSQEAYNKEYEDCGQSEDPVMCRSQLKTLHSEIDKNKDALKDFLDTKGSSSGKSASTIAIATGAGIGIAMSGFVTQTAACPSGTGAGLAAGALAIVGFMGMQDDMGGEIKKQIEEQMKRQEQQHKTVGWNKQSEISGLKMQINFLENIIKMAKDAESAHSTQMGLYTAIGAIAAVCVAATPVWCPDTCAVPTVASAALGVVLESKAKSAASNAKNKAKKSLSKAKALLAKLDPLYDPKKRGWSSQTATNTASNQSINTQSTGNSASTPQFSNAELLDQAWEEAREKGKRCVNSPTSMSKNCNQSFSYKMKVPNTKIGKAVAEKIGLDQHEVVLNKMFQGKYQEAMQSNVGSGTNLAAGQKIFRRVAQRALKTNKDLSDQSKMILSSVANGNLSPLASTIKSDPTAMTAAMSKHGFGLGSGSNFAIGEANRVSEKNQLGSDELLKVTKTRNSKNSFAHSKKVKLPTVDEIDLNDIGANSIESKTGLESEFAAIDIDQSKLSQEAIIHPDQKISIFKIITNRYNYMRVYKKLGGK